MCYVTRYMFFIECEFLAWFKLKRNGLIILCLQFIDNQEYSIEYDFITYYSNHLNEMLILIVSMNKLIIQFQQIIAN